MLSRAALAAVLTLPLAACASGDERPTTGQAGPAPQLSPPQAAEPVAGPPVTEKPPGTVVRVGENPEGVAIDPQTRVAAVAVQNPPRLVLLDSSSGRRLR